jgi:hypothetical protein
VFEFAHLPTPTYFAVGGVFSVGELGRRRPELLTQNWNRLFSVPNLAIGYIAFDYCYDSARQNIGLRVGAGYHQVSMSKFDTVTNGIGRLGEPVTYAHPFVSLEYRNERIDNFRLGALYSKLLMLSAWAEIIPNFVNVEVRFSTVLFRSPKEWEHKNYIYGTLGFTFDF